MRIVVNGWFSDQLAAGSGQYLAGLVDWLPGAGSESEFILVRPAVSRQPSAISGQPSGNTEREAGITNYALRLTFHASPPGWQTIEASTPFDHLSRNLAKLWFEQVAFPRACRRLRAGVALVPYWGSPWWQPCPVVVTIHDLIPLLLPLYRGGPLQRVYTWLVGRTARRAHAILTDSEASRRDIIAHLGVPPERVRAVHLAADPGYRPVADATELARVRSKYRLPAEPFLLYLGGFDARKNVGRMIQGYAGMTQQLAKVGGRPRLKLVIAGKLPDGDSAFAPDPRLIVEQLGIQDRVHFIGWVDEADKPGLYSLATGAMYLSEYEGFGLPVLEAMGCGCAMIAGGNARR